MPPAQAADAPIVTSPLAATAASPVVAIPPPQQPATIPPAATQLMAKPRPLAPDVSFVKRGEAPPPATPSPAAERLDRAETLAAPSVTCALCGSANQRGLRFCSTCGQPLTAAPASADHIGAIELMRTVVDSPKGDSARPEPAAGADLAFAPIAPARVIDVGAVAAPAQEQSCPRCQGAYEAGAQFCRFCGLPLSGAGGAGTGATISVQRPAVTVPTPIVSPPSVPPRPTANALSTPIRPPRPKTASGPALALRAPLTPPAAYLVLITREGTEGARHALGDSIDLGRSEGSVVFSDDQFVSPRHARIVSRGGAFYLRDLESTNGVFVRIPFSVSGAEGDEDPLHKGPKEGPKKDHVGSRSNVSETVPDARSEQPLADQELFLVGQQVLRFEVVKQAEEGFGAACENGTLIFGTPAAARYARLSQRTVEGLVRDVFHVRKAETVIGRESGDIVFTDDPFLSRRHAVIRVSGGGGQPRTFTLADLGSSNGTFLRVRDEVRLQHGDHFRIGQQLLRFDIDATHAGV